MTPHSLWTILLKILGISILIDALTVVPQSISTAVTVGQSFSPDSSVNIPVTIGIILFALLIYLIAIWIFLFKTGWLITKLALDRHFREDKIEINIHHSTVLQIAIIIIGGLIFVDSLPEFCREVFSFYQQKSVFRENPTTNWVIFHFVKTFIAYLLMTNSKRLTDWIENKRQKE